jgi:plasmid replication initiation protein
VPYITRLEAEFTKYDLKKIAKMSSPYAIRMYEFLIQWGSVGKREIELAWIRRTLMIEDKYASIKDFKKYVIDVATHGSPILMTGFPDCISIPW